MHVAGALFPQRRGQAGGNARGFGTLFGAGGPPIFGGVDGRRCFGDFLSVPLGMDLRFGL